tara:strand:- start:24429 stop:25211 length:783 start_codon:yes stop_codon:yes gene_type:complete
MKISVFTSNQPRHLNLVIELSKIVETVYFISEVNTIFPGKLEDFFKKSDVMQKYFSHVMRSEKKIFGGVKFLPKNIKTLLIKSGDLNMLNKDHLSESMESDLFIVFGSSFIKGWLVDYLIKKNAINIHMGLSPYYRGSSCNFWAMFDNKPEYVGATIHRLSKGLDSGDMYFHCLPKFSAEDNPFDFTMRSVKVAHKALLEKIKSNEIFAMRSIKQNPQEELRYTRNKDFNDNVAYEFLERNIYFPKSKLIYPALLNPIFG